MVQQGLYNTSLTKPIVSVYPLSDQQKYRITWPAQPAATGYRVYGGYDPLSIRSLISGADPIPAGQTSFDFSVPSIPPSYTVYFWVAAEEPSGRRFLDEWGSYSFKTAQYDQFNNPNLIDDDIKATFCDAESMYYMEEMRRRAKSVLSDTGEEVDLYIRQWRGLPDPTTQPELGLDPNYQGMSRNDASYGLGYYPGFFPAIRIRVRFGGLPVSIYDYQLPGMRPMTQNEAWTLWEPLMHEHDMIVRVNTGARYVVKQNSNSNYRGIPLTQRFQIEAINPTDPIYKITDSEIRSKWANLDAIGYNRIGFGVMPSASPDLKDYFIMR